MMSAMTGIEYFAIPELLRTLYAANPRADFVGTDLSSTSVLRSFEDADVALVREMKVDAACSLRTRLNCTNWSEPAHLSL